MAQVKYASRAWKDIERIFEFYAEQDPQLATQVVALITSAVEILADHPWIGRKVEAGLRELVVSHGRTGFLALYRHRERDGLIAVLAVRHQREAGYRA